MAEHTFIYRASALEELAYNCDPTYLYPLYGYIFIAGTKCIIEDLRGDWDRDNPQYEIIAPKGKIFVPDGVHSMLCFDYADIQERIAGVELVDCSDDCCK